MAFCYVCDKSGSHTYTIKDYWRSPRTPKGMDKNHVSLSNDGSDGFVCRVPKPILEILGKPDRIKFVLKGSKIDIVSDWSFKINS